jgi:hypothetical protein
MKTPTIALSLLFGTTLLAAGAAQADVKVTFVKPEQFADMPFGQSEKDRVLKELEAHFGKLGAKGLSADQVLKVDVTDIDLAGRLNFSGHGPMDMRILNGRADWPRMSLHYSLEANGKVLQSGDVHLADMNYMSRVNRYFSSEPLRYEKAMMDDWFRKTFQQRQSPQ